MKRVFLSAAAAVGTLMCASADVVLFDRETSYIAAVSMPEDASPSQRYAAKEYVSCLKRMTGLDVPVVVGVRGRGSVRIMTAEPSENLGDDGFTLRVKGKDLEVRGSRVRGCLYGVYELLERFGGFRWYASWCEKVPESKRFSVPGDLNLTQRPAFRMRQPFWYDVIHSPRFAARNKINGFNHTNIEVPEEIGGDGFRFGGGLPSAHTFDELLPVARHFKEHPEWYSFFKGKRQSSGSQLCLTNPEVVKRVTEELLRRIRKDPGARFYGVSQNDWQGYCECPKCAAVDAEEESHAGTMVRFVNAVAEAVEKEFPDVIIETLAYMYTRKAPKKARYRHNVVPCLCTYECDITHDLATGSYFHNAAFRKDIRDWGSMVSELYVWDYSTTFGGYVRVCPNLGPLASNIRFFRDNKVQELFIQGDGQGHHAHYAELKAWLQAKLMWNPDCDEKELLRDFTDGFYGEAGVLVREDIEELTRLYAQGGKCFDCECRQNLPGLSPDYFTHARMRIDRMLELTKGDGTAAYNVRALAFALDYTMLERFRIARKDEQTWTEAERDYVALLSRRLLDFLAEAHGSVRLKAWDSDWNENPRYAVENWLRFCRGVGK